MFLDGADKKVFGYLMKSLRNNFTLGNDKYPVTMEDALQVLTMNLPRKKVDGKSTEAVSSFNQVGGKKVKCWYCEEEGHIKQNCPKKKKDDENKSEGEKKDETGTSHVTKQVSWSGG